MRKARTAIILGIVFISNFNCKKDITLPEVITIGVTASEQWNGVNYARFVYIGEGRIISDGGGNLISKGICFSSVNKSPTISDTLSSGVSGDNDSFKSMLNLQNGQIKYYLRAFAQNKAGISYGGTVTYITYCGSDWDVEWACKYIPQLYSPPAGTSGLPLSVTLKWIHVLPGACNVYLDTLNATTLIASNVVYSQLEVTGLKPSTTYYWKLAKPCCKDTITSVVWSFSTQ
jgi:hypothetical protein